MTIPYHHSQQIRTNKNEPWGRKIGNLEELKLPILSASFMNGSCCGGCLQSRIVLFKHAYHICLQRMLNLNCNICLYIHVLCWIILILSHRL